MSFKEKAVAALREAANNDCGPARTVIRECADLVENILDEVHEKIPCAAPNYEAMYHDAMKNLEQARITQEHLENDIRKLQFENGRLYGFREAVELIFGERCDCHGHG